MRRVAIYCITILIGILAPLMALEIILRFLPVTDILDTQPVNQTSPYIHFRPNRDITFSKAWNFSILTRKHINNYGYMNDVDFSKGETTPLLVIIGDSYVEATHVFNKDSMHGLLSNRVGRRGRVYGIGYSGTALSQYLAFAEFSRKEFSPNGMVFIIVGNDFDESLTKYGWGPGFHYFSPGDFSVTRIDWPGKTWAGFIVSQSALARYVRGNLSFDPTFLSWLWKGNTAKTSAEFVGNTRANADQERLEDSKAVVDNFLIKVPMWTGLARDKVLFVIDGMRPSLYSPEGMDAAKGSYFDLMRQYFIGKSRQLGHAVVDMQPVFERDYSMNKKRFEFEVDAHWNERGHQLVADEIEKTSVFRAVFFKARARVLLGANDRPIRGPVREFAAAVPGRE